jgi:hypothetical protein
MKRRVLLPWTVAAASASLWGTGTGLSDHDTGECFMGSITGVERHGEDIGCSVGQCSCGNGQPSGPSVTGE